MNASTPHHDEAPAAARLGRLLPLAGVGVAVLTFAGDLTIGKFPDSGTPAATLTHYYATHHHHVAAGGMLLAWAGVLLAFFGAALWARIRSTSVHPVVAGAVLVGTAVAAADAIRDASTYVTLGDIGGNTGVAPAALQAWHIGGSDGGVGGGMTILLVAVAVAGIAARAIPRWLAWPALAIGILLSSPFGFLASLVFLLWAAVTGIVMVLRPANGGRTEAAAGSALLSRSSLA